MMQGTSLKWVSHPFLDDGPLKSSLLVVFILGLSIGVYFTFGGFLYAGITFAFLFFSLSRYFLPVQYELTEMEVRISHLGFTRVMLWRNCRNLYTHREGIYLSSFARPSPLDAFRGCFLRFKANREEVIAFARSKMEDRED